MKINLFSLLAAFILCPSNLLPAYSLPQDLIDLEGEQASEKSELEQMRQQLKELKSTTQEADAVYKQLNASPLKKGFNEFHLFCQNKSHEISPDKSIDCLTYNGLLPGPTLRVKEGQLVRIVIHNQLQQSTSFHIHGMILPDSVDGIPTAKGGLIKPGQTYAYQFVAKPAGTYWYHPQIIHADQKTKGMYGTLIVEPENPLRTNDQDLVLMLGETPTYKEKSATTTSAASKTSSISHTSIKPVFLVNGKTAPAIPVMEVRPNSLVHMRIINAAQHSIPLHISGHKFNILSLNGDSVTGRSTDTINCNVSDRLDLEFKADNPGLWSLGSEKLDQCTVNGQFPGGVACLIKYVE